MKKKILPILVLLIGFGNCKKAKFEPFKEPYEILLLDKATVEIFSEPKETSKSLGTFSGKDKLEATGMFYLEELNKTFIQIKCPVSFQDCKEGFGYIDASLIYKDSSTLLIFHPYQKEDRFTSETKGYLIKIHSIDKARAIFEWFHNPSAKLPESISTDFIKLFLLSIQNPDKKLKKVTELYLFFKAFQEPLKAKDIRLEPIRKKYSALKELYTIFIEKNGEGWESSYLSKVSIDKYLVSSLYSLRESLIKEFEDGFPYRKDSWKGLESEFNSLSRSLYLKERILQKALEDASYSITNAPYTTIKKYLGK